MTKTSSEVKFIVSQTAPKKVVKKAGSETAPEKVKKAGSKTAPEKAKKAGRGTSPKNTELEVVKEEALDEYIESSYGAEDIEC